MELSLKGMAERSGGGLIVTSAGTRALEGEGMPSHGLKVATELGLKDAAHHVARQLTPEIITEADLILVATSAHVREVALMNASSQGTLFSLRSFAHLVRNIDDDEWPAGSLHSRLTYASQRRDLLPFLADETSLDIPDPFRRSFETYQRTGDVISREVESLAPMFGW
jgi:protein-tyrosine phosphatase